MIRRGAMALVLLSAHGCGGPDLKCGMGTHQEADLCARDPSGDPVLESTPWSRSVRVDSGGSTTSAPAVAVDSKGRVFVAFQTGEFFSSAVEVWRSDDAKTFARAFVTPASSVAIRPSLAVDGADRVIVVWNGLDRMTGTVGISQAVSSDGIKFDDFEETVPLTGFVITRPAIGPTPDGRVAVAWTDDMAIAWATTATDTGRLLGTNRIRSVGYEVMAPLAFDGSGHGYALALHSDIENLAVDVVSLDAGAVVFNQVIGFTRHYSFQLGGAMVTDGDGHLRLIYTDARSQRTGIFEARSDTGARWNDARRILDGGAPNASAKAPSLAADPQGGLHALWYDTRDGGWLTYAADAPPGGDFGTPERVGDTPAFEDLSSSTSFFETALAARNGMRYAVWTDARGGVFYAAAPMAPH